MLFKIEQLNTAKLFEKLSYVYKHYFINKREYLDQIDKKKGYLALKIFLDSYAYERQRAPKTYKKIALESISHHFEDGCQWHLPTLKDAKLIWEIYKLKAMKDYNLIKYTKNNIEAIKVNQKRNPMNEDKGIIGIMAKHKIENIAEHVCNNLINGKTIYAHKAIKDVRGIGNKIASFYLRDIADKSIELGYIKNESDIMDIHMLQPMDIWLNRIFSLLFKRDNYNLMKNRN